MTANLITACDDAIQHKPAAITKSVQNNSAARAHCVLIADDDAEVRELLKLQFEAEGFHVLLAGDGEKAWHIMQHETVDAVVLDWGMPIYAGTTVLCMIREHQLLKDVPVIMLTARSYGAEVLEGYASGASDYITKPFSADQVTKRCAELIERRSAAVASKKIKTLVH